MSTQYAMPNTSGSVPKFGTWCIFGVERGPIKINGAVPKHDEGASLDVAQM